MAKRLDQKWRPPLLLVLGGALAAVLTLPIFGLFALRLLSPQLGFRISALIIAAVVMLATAVLAFLLWRLLLNPVTALAERAALMKSGQAGSDAPLRHFGTQELRDLGQSVLDMGQTLQNREATIRSFTDHVTHELKTPLTAIKGAAEMLAVQLRRDHPGLTLSLSGAAIDLPIAEERLFAILTQLLTNAAQHGASAVKIAGLEQPALLVSDNGPGISEGNRAQIFDPFFTTRREAGGTGMGLNIAQAFLQAQGAQIILAETGPTGSTFKIEF